MTLNLLTKQKIISVCLAIFCCSIVSAQQIDRKRYERLVDYTNCKYTEAYFDKKIDDVSISRLFRQDYTERIKKILSVVTEENANSRMKMLAPLKSYKSGKVLIEFIESKKDAFNETWNGTQIVENLLALPEEGEFTVLLKDEMENLKKYFYENLLHQRNERADERATTQNDSINLFAENQAENANSDTSIFFENVKLFVQKTAYPLIAVVILLVLFIFFRKNIINFIKDIIGGFHNKDLKQMEIDAEKNLLDEVKKLRIENKNLTDKVFHIKYENDEVRREIDKICRERDMAYQKIRDLEKNQ